MRSDFGITTKGEKASLYTMKNQKGMEIAVSDYGAVLVKVLVPDKEGDLLDVVLGYDEVSGYESDGLYLGATVGRVANRIGGGQFELNGRNYTLTKNDAQNTLHGGTDFYNKRMWQVEEADDSHITLLLHSRDGDQGFPGTVDIRVTYTLTEDNEIRIHYHAVPQEDTLLNLTNHSYFNLSGHASGTAMDQEVVICADAYTRADAQSIPTGEIVPVDGTPMDFRKGKAIGAEIEADYEALEFGKGYDHNWIINGAGYRHAASMYSEKTGIGMKVYTDLPGMQFYTGNFITHADGKDGAVYQKRGGVCFESQYFPDAVHKENFEGPVVKAGTAYDTTTAYHFSLVLQRD